MEFDLSSQPEIVQQAYRYALQGWELALSWLLSPAAWSQFALLVLAYLLAVLVARRLRPLLATKITPPRGIKGVLADARRYCAIPAAIADVTGLCLYRNWRNACADPV